MANGNDSSQPVIRTTDSNDGPLHAHLERTEGVVTDDKVHIVRYFFSEGITKREMYAAMAMQGIFAHGGPLMPNESVEAAEYAVRAADALLKELAK